MYDQLHILQNSFTRANRFFKALYVISTLGMISSNTCILFPSHCTPQNTYSFFNLTGENMDLEFFCPTAALSKCKAVTL